MTKDFSYIFTVMYRQYVPTDIVVVEPNIDIMESVSIADKSTIYCVSTDDRHIFQHPNTHVINTLLWNENALIGRYNYNVSFLNSSLPLECVRKILPNVRLIDSYKIQSTSFVEFFVKHSLVDSNKFLIINELSQVSRFNGIDLIALKISVLAVCIMKYDMEDFEEYALKQSFVKICFCEGNHPNIGILILAKDIMVIEKDVDEQLINQSKELAIKNKELESIRASSAKKELELRKQVDAKANELIDYKPKVLPNLNKLDVSELSDLSLCEFIAIIVQFSLNQESFIDSIDDFLLGEVLTDSQKFELCLAVSLELNKMKERINAISYLNNSRYFVCNESMTEDFYTKLIDISLKLNDMELAIDLEQECQSKYGKFDSDTNKKIYLKYMDIRAAGLKKQAHGHQLLLDYLESLDDKDVDCKTLVEIGTTRENIPSQGSTQHLAKLCKRKGIKFITVDMDPHNTRWANFLSKKYNLDFVAITKKGEDFLANDIEVFDFVFLDAYDFDHGKHSELRQKRYEDNLGSRIDEIESHKMHLECVKSIVNKIKDGGVVCIDDTWKNDEDKWVAKGASAVPFLLDNEFNILEARNNAVILNRRVNES